MSTCICFQSITKVFTLSFIVFCIVVSCYESIADHGNVPTYSSQGTAANHSKNKTSPVYKDQPIQIVKPDEQHKKLILIKENLRFMQSIAGPVATVAVVGKFHSGKSFLMNQLMGKSGGFGIGPSVKPETMGIWMWGKPAIMKIASGLKVSVIFLDTEGFAANNVSENYDAKIFAVATLLSSHLLFNSVKIIDQVDIDYLELLARRTQLFALRSQISRNKWSESFNQALLTFPPLTWIVQDFVQATNENENPKQWLHSLMDTHTRENEEYEIGLLGMFKSVDCHTLFLPAISKKLLSDLSQVTEADLTEEYKQERDELIEKLKREIVPKEKNSVPLNGAELAALLELLVNAANEGSLAEVPSRWDGFIQKLEQTAVEDCKMFYESELNILQEEHENGPIEEKLLREWHMKTLEKSVHLLEQLLQGLDDANTNGKKKLQGDILVIYEKFHNLNDKKVKLRCTELQHREELNAEESLRSVNLPISTSSLKKHVNAVAQQSIQALKGELSKLVNEENQKKYLSFFKKTLSNHVAALELENTKALEAFFRDAITSAHAKFASRSENLDGQPHKPAVLKRIIDDAKRDAFMEFEEKCKIFGKETAFSTYLAVLKSEMEDHIKKVEEENNALVDVQIEETVKELVQKFRDATGDTKIALPVNYAELVSRLSIEKTRVFREYADILEDFKDYKSYTTRSQSLINEIEEICEERKHANTKAFAEEVKKPLSKAKKIILLSSDKFATPFSLKKYIREICLLQLNEGKAQYWSTDLKESIIEHFVANDKDLSKSLNEKSTFWSRLLGFFEWLLWILGVIH